MPDRLLPTLDAAADHQLRAALRTFAAHSTDPDFRELVDDALAGRRAVRDVLDAPGLREPLVTGLAGFSAEWEGLTTAERAELAQPRAR